MQPGIVARATRNCGSLGIVARATRNCGTFKLGLPRGGTFRGEMVIGAKGQHCQ